MRTHNFKATLKAAVKVASLLFFGAVAAFGQSTVNLTAAPTSTTMPDGKTVPMWGYFCGGATTTSTTVPVASCVGSNPASVSTVATVPSTWSPVVITVPYVSTGTSLTINLTNNLYFQPPTPTGGTAPAANLIPTSLTIVGQIGGGLGTANAACPAGGTTCDASPSHAGLVTDNVTWSTVGSAPGFTPPPQLARARSLATEVAPVAAGTVVTCSATATSGCVTLTWSNLSPGTYLIESGTHPSIQGPMGLYGMLVVTCPPSATSACGPAATPVAAGTGQAYPAGMNGLPNAGAVNYNSEADVIFSEADPVQNNAVQAAVMTAGFSETTVWSGQPGGCGNPGSATYNQCYPPAVNYTPLYYMVNGIAFNKTNAAGSLIPATPGTTATPVAAGGTVLVRFVNAGLRMHVPSIIGTQTTGFNGAGVAGQVNGFSIVAEDGNPLPGVPKVQNEVLAVPGKVLDLTFNVPAGGSAIPIYDRELSLSAGAVGHDGGMIAYISVNGSALPVTPGTAGSVFAPATVANIAYNAVPACAAAPCSPLSVSDPGKGVISVDTNVYGVELYKATAAGSTLVLNPNGTFTYTPAAGAFTSDSFQYCANGSVTTSGTTTTCSSGLIATVTLGPEGAVGTITAHNRAYAANTSSYFALKSPGVLGTQYDITVSPPPTPDVDSAGFPLHVATAGANAPVAGPGLTLVADPEGGFTASVPVCPSTQALPGCTYSFTYYAQDSQGTLSSAPGTVTITFPPASNLSVTVLDGYDKTTVITDYRWVIEEDRSFYVNPQCLTNTLTPPAGCPSQTATAGQTPILGVNFHTDYMPFVAQGCTGPLSCEGGQMMFDNNPSSPTFGRHIQAVCDVGDGVCRPDTTGNGFTQVLPSSVHLDPSKRYYISVLPGDAADPFAAGYTGGGCQYGAANAQAGATCGHGMGGTAIPAACTIVAPATSCTGTFAPVTALSQPSPYPPGRYTVFVFEDDAPLNGEFDGGGGTGPVNTNTEKGLGGFQIHLWDAMGKFGDFTGQMSYDMFNQPLTNSLAGMIDPTTGKDACPITENARYSTNGTTATPFTTLQTDTTATGKTGMIVTCPEYEADGVTPSPLAGQAVVDNLMPGQWAGIATPGADRIARGEEWLQTNTLDGQKGHDIFTRIGEPSYFQEYGPAAWHNAIGFANPAIINARHAAVCAGTDPTFPQGAIPCNNTLTGRVTGERLSHPPDERLYSSSSHDAFAWSQCYVSFGDPDGEDFAFTKCDADGNFTFTNLPDGDWRIVVFDEWNDEIVDGLSTPVRLSAGNTAATTNIGDIATQQWQTNIQTRTFIDDNKNGISDAGEAGIPFENVAVRLRDGQLYNLLVTDFTGTANFNETFPLFAWYTVETDVTRYKNTGTHVVYDVGGPADGSTSCGVTGYPPCGNSVIGKYLANTAEVISLPTNLRVPGAVYCKDADCSTHNVAATNGIQAGPSVSDPPSSCTSTTTTTGTGNAASPTTSISCSTVLSSGRIDPPFVGVEGWQGFIGQFNFLEFGKEPYAPGENGGIHGHVIYASTRPFDDPQQLVQTQWTPLIPNVTINLYQESYAADNVTPTLTLVDTTKTSSWDDWAQGFHLAADGVTKIPNMNCPGQGGSNGVDADLFFFTLSNQPNYLDYYNNVHGGPAITPLPNNSQFKCYDGMHNWNQIQPAPYDGMYQFPSVTSTDPTTGKPLTTNCTICTPNHAVPTTDLYYGLPMLPAGKYVVEVVVPPGFELVKEEDKNILIGDNFIAPVTQQFGGLGGAFIIPDQASIASTYCASGCPGAASNAYNANNPQNPTQAFGTNLENGIVPSFVPEPIWPCVGEARVVPDYISLYPQTHQVSPFAGATRNLCDRKEVTLTDQMGAIAKFFLYTSIHTASKFTGIITDDFTSEFDPFAPTFGEKFSPPDMPISVKDWTGAETSRIYSDHWGVYDGMTYSTWEVNPPNPTGYSPTMMVFCMNDPGPIMDTNPSSLTYLQTITDPLFNPLYSQFCYELAFMPETTAYEDTPVVPNAGFVGAGYNNVDCSYPDATPAISEVDGDSIGPWVSAANHTLTIHSLGDQMVTNNAYAGPAATTAPYNAKTIKRHYGFGASQRNGSLAAGGVTIGGVNAPVTHWDDTTITVTVPSGVPRCPVQQQLQYGGPGSSGTPALCGELVITTGASNVGGNVTGVSVAPPPTGNRGGTYTGNPPVAPTVTFSGGGGTGAAAHAVLGSSTGSVASVNVTSGGSGYTGNFTVTFSGGGGTGAHGTATVRRMVTGLSSTGGTNRTHVYTSRPTVVFSGGGGGATQAVATAIMSIEPAGTGTVTGIHITSGGSYSLTGGTIAVTFTGGGSTSANRTSIPATTTGFVSSVTMTGGGNSGGSGYSTAPTPVFPTPTGGTAAAGTSTLSASRTATVVSVVIDNGGSGYTSAPTVTFSGPASTRAVGTAAINGPATTVSGKQSIDTVTVTIGGKQPTHVAASASVQAAIDAAAPGDLIIVDPTCSTTGQTTLAACAPNGVVAAGGTPAQLHSTAEHDEILIMWKPVRLQGVAGATSIVNANTHPAGKMDVWRQHVNCLFGLALNGAPISNGPTSANATGNPYDPTGAVSCPGTGWNYFNAYDESGVHGNPNNPQIDRLPLETTVGWVSDLNGNLAEMLQEPGLMGALEGAAVTVLSKGVNFPSDPYNSTLLAGFPTGTTLLQNTVSNPAGALCGTDESTSPAVPNRYPSNYSCNPSSIDGLGLTDSSQGGGGIFVHGWGHNIQIANNRIYSNAGTLAGGINVGQGEFAPAYIQGSATNAAPGSCEESPVANAVLPYCENVNVNIHNNYIALNSSTGDELFSGTPTGAGGVDLCTGSDYYKFNYNWVCGNLSSGDGGGFGHLGFSYNGDIEHNTIIFNQSNNPTIPANAGGMVIMGAPDADLVCNGNANLDQDCVPFGAPGGNPGNTAVTAIGPSDGVGPGLVVNGNLIMGNNAESGTGGGVAFNAVNGSDMVAFPNDPAQWNSVQFTNNIVVDNVSGWDGGGISLLDSPNVNIINNTIAYNASTGSSGILFNTLGAPRASQTGSSCTTTATTTCPQPGGLVAIQHSAVLAANMPSTLTCPPGHFAPGTSATFAGTTPPTCATVSYPKLENNIFWNNASYFIGVGALSPTFQQNIVALYNAFTGSAIASQSATPSSTTTGGSTTITGGTGACVSGTQYWDIAVRGDTGPGDHSSNVTLNPTQSVMTNTSGYSGSNRTGNPAFVSQYCNGSRTSPETPGVVAAGWQVPAGIADANVPNPIFNVTPSATVDESNNWVNLSYGPLTMTNPTQISGANGNYGGGLPLGNYSITSTSAARNVVTATQNLADAPRYDFFNTQRANDADPSGPFDAGAIEFVPTGPAGGNGTELTVSPAVVDFPFVPLHSGLSQDQDVQVINSGSATVAPLVSLQNSASNNFSLTPAPDPNGCPINSTSLTLGLGESCIVNVSFTPETPSTTGLRAGTLTVNGGGVTQTIPLNGHITVGTISIVSTIPNGTLNPTPAAVSPATVTGTITLGNSENPATDPDAGPWVLTAPPSFTQTGTGTFTLGGTCTTGVNVFPGQTCTITVTYAPPATGSPTGSISVFFAQGTVLGTQTQGWTANFNVQSNIPAN